MSTLKRRSANASTGFSPGQIEEAWSYNLSPALRREVRKNIFEHFDLICEEWERRREA